MAGGAQIEARDSDTGATPLHLAADFNHPNIVKTLVDVYKASINVTDEYGNSALHLASDKGHVDVIKILLHFGHCDVNSKGQFGQTALHESCQEGHVACIQELLAGGAQVEARSSDIEATPLHLAASISHVDGDTAVDDARSEGHQEIVALLEAKIKGKLIRCTALLHE